MDDMQAQLHVSLVQAATVWHDPVANQKLFARQLQTLTSAEPQPDLVLLPEMWSTGFTMASTEVAETMDGPSVAWMVEQAGRLDCVVAGSLVIEDDGHYFNRFIAADADGLLLTYDKRHLFRMADEHEHYQAGGAKQTFMVKGWRVCPMVCYDLRFPVWFRNQADYDLLVCVANWPAARREAWTTLLKARAIENQAYVAAVNIVGVDGNEVVYSGGSAAYSADGAALCELFDEPAMRTVKLERAPLLELRAAFPVWRDADRYQVEL